jgi:hypothetical protein
METGDADADGRRGLQPGADEQTGGISGATEAEASLMRSPDASQNEKAIQTTQ